MKHRTVTCDVCGVTKDDPGDVEAFGWFTVSRTGYYAGEPPPRDTAPPRPPDLCSWKCVAVYAEKRAQGARAAEAVAAGLLPAVLRDWRGFP